MSWPIVKLGEIFDIARGGSPRPIQNYITDDPEGLNWIMIGDTKGDSKYIERVAKKIKREGLGKTRLVQPGDFLLTNSMSFGRPYILKTSGCIHDGWLVLSPKSDNLHTDYFYYCLSSDAVYQKLSAKAAGAVVKNLNTGIVKELEVPLPPLPIQKQIAALLEKADTLRSQCKQMKQELNQLAQSVFLEMFGDPVTNPKGWSTRTLDDVCLKITDGTHHSPEPLEKGIPYVTAKHLKENGLDFYRAPTYVSEDAHKEIFSRCNPEKGDVLYIKDGATTGIAAINEYDFEFSMLSSLALLKPGNELRSNYLMYWLNNQKVKNIILRNIAGAAITRLTLKKINAISVNVPPIAEQEKFVSFVHKLDKIRSDCDRKSKELDANFSSLMQRAFSGQLNLTKAA